MPHSILCPWISIPTCPRVYWSMTKSVQEGGKRQVVLSPRSVSWRLFCRRLRHSARAEEVGVAQVIVPLKEIFNWTQTHSTCSQLIWLNRPSAPGNVVPLKSIRHLALCWHSIFFFSTLHEKYRDKEVLVINYELNFSVECRKTWSSCRQQNSTHHNHRSAKRGRKKKLIIGLRAPARASKKKKKKKNQRKTATALHSENIMHSLFNNHFSFPTHTMQYRKIWMIFFRK